MEKKRNWSAICYDDNFKEALAEAQNYAYIYHDKDEKEPHYHVIVCFKNPRSITGVKKLLKGNSEQNVLVQPCISLKGAYEYLLHKNEEEKYKYNPEERITNNENHFLYDQATSTAMSILQDVIDKTPLLELVAKWGREVIINYEKYKDMAERIATEERMEDEKRLLLEQDQARKADLQKYVEIRWNRKVYKGTVTDVAKEAHIPTEMVLEIDEKQNKKGE